MSENTESPSAGASSKPRELCNICQYGVEIAHRGALGLYSLERGGPVLNAVASYPNAPRIVAHAQCALESARED